MIILGIETSCDETSAALLEIKRERLKVLSHVVSSSVKEQKKYGGIIPEVAARKQMEYMIPVLNETFKQEISNSKFLISKQSPKTKKQNSERLGLRALNLALVKAIAVTVGPGLATSLQVGIDAAKTLAYVWQKPLIPINHLEGHLYSPLLSGVEGQVSGIQIKFPAIALIVSGGHTELILVKDYLEYKLLGRTRDDAAGEAFDKVAKLLGLGYPGGPIISQLAHKGNSHAYDFPRGMIDSGNFDFSFSGLKTAVLYATKKNKNMMSKKQLPHVAASFEQAVVDVLVSKTMKALAKHNAKTLLVGGGVSADPYLRKGLQDVCDQLKITCCISPIKFTGDNAAMIAIAGYFCYKAGKYIMPNPQLKKWQDIRAQPNMKLV